MKTPYNEFLNFAADIAQVAGDIQKEYFRSKKFGITEKGNAFDVVTTADKESESIICSMIHMKYPSHSILSEESGLFQADAEYQWVIDPLDGTTNFSSGLPLFNVSIGLKHNGTTVAGVVLAPALNELFYAEKGKGAWLNGKRIKVKPQRSLEHSVISTGFPYDKALTDDNNLGNVARVLPHVRGLRRLGSAAIDICYVAAGFLDGYWEIALHEWDVCAASLIATEAGATVTPLRNDRDVSLMVTTPGIHDKLRALLLPPPID